MYFDLETDLPHLRSEKIEVNCGFSGASVFSKCSKNREIPAKCGHLQQFKLHIINEIDPMVRSGWTGLQVYIAIQANSEPEVHFDLERELPNLRSENIEVNHGISATSAFL